MSFNLEIWREQAAQKLQHIGQWLHHHQQNNLPYLAYGTVAGLAIWPMVEAVAQTGQFWPAVGALYGVVGSIGGNLLAEQLQRWKDQATPPTETEIAVWVSQSVAQHTDLRQAVDVILEQVQAFPQAQTALNAADRAWFQQLLTQELTHLGNLSRFQGTLIGSGGLAQGDGAIAVGEKAIYVGGHVGGDVIMGNKITADPTQVDPQALHRAYLHRVLTLSNQLPLAGVDPKMMGEENAQLELAAVYTALLTETADKPDELRPDLHSRPPQRRSALEMLDAHPHLVLLGEPGSGKSTFVSFVAACLAGSAGKHPVLNLALLTRPLPAADRSGDKKEEPQPWRHGALLPVHVVLRDLVGWLPAAGQPATANHLWQFLTAELQKASLADYTPLLKKTLLEQGGLLLFDGLDEVPQADDHRLHIKQLVADVARTFGRCRILVTSRTYAYQQQAWRLPGFTAAVLAPFSQEQIDVFVVRWYTHIAQVRHLKPEDAQGRAVLLRRAIAGSRRLQELAERPLLLTLMSSLHAWRGGSLPEKREELYADAVELLLDNWEKQRLGHDARGVVQLMQPSLQQWLQVDRDRVRRQLDQLAYNAHAAQPSPAPGSDEGIEGTADIAEPDLIMALLHISQNPAVNPVQLVEYLRDRAGLLLPRGVGVYTFPHRTFQEYLAATHLTHHDYPTEVAKLARHEPGRWREVALLAGARAGRGSSFALWSLVQELCYGEPGETATTADHWGARLAGQLLVENGLTNGLSQAQQEQCGRVKRWLVAVMTGTHLPALERAGAGRALAHLGDERPGVGVVEKDGLRLPDIRWGQEVPAGVYTIGGDTKAFRSFDGREVQIKQPYQLARYPVTQTQFHCFAAAEDFADGRWWWGIPAREQKLGNPYFPFGNHPRERVSWYQAIAFCRWLSDKLGEEVDLPHEYEWEVAARYPDGRFYPWGNTFDKERANTAEGNIGQTTAVGIYPAGQNPALELYDLSGNVWEWCHNKYKQPEETSLDQSGDRRVLRGGAWYDVRPDARAAYRHADHPGLRLNGVGFRVVVRRPPSR